MQVLRYASQPLGHADDHFKLLDCTFGEQLHQHTSRMGTASHLVQEELSSIETLLMLALVALLASVRGLCAFEDKCTHLRLVATPTTCG